MAKVDGQSECLNDLALMPIGSSDHMVFYASLVNEPLGSLRLNQSLFTLKGTQFDFSSLLGDPENPPIDESAQTVTEPPQPLYDNDNQG